MSRLNELEQRWRQEPRSRVYLQLAEEYRKLGRCSDAIEVLQSGLEHRPSDLSALVLLGRCQLESGDVASASQTLQGVVQRDATHIVANKLLIDAYLQEEDAESAAQRLGIYRLLNDRDPEIAHLEFRLDALQPADDPEQTEETAVDNETAPSAEPAVAEEPAETDHDQDPDRVGEAPAVGSGSADGEEASTPPDPTRESPRSSPEVGRSGRDADSAADPFPGVRGTRADLGGLWSVASDSVEAPFDVRGAQPTDLALDTGPGIGDTPAPEASDVGRETGSRAEAPQPAPVSMPEAPGSQPAGGDRTDLLRREVGEIVESRADAEEEVGTGEAAAETQLEGEPVTLETEKLAPVSDREPPSSEQEEGADDAAAASELPDVSTAVATDALQHPGEPSVVEKAPDLEHEGSEELAQEATEKVDSEKAGESEQEPELDAFELGLREKVDDEAAFAEKTEPAEQTGGATAEAVLTGVSKGEGESSVVPPVGDQDRSSGGAEPDEVRLPPILQRDEGEAAGTADRDEASELPPAAEVESEGSADAEATEDEPAATVTLGRLYLKQGHRLEAARVFSEVLDRDPENVSAMEGFAAATRLRAGDLVPDIEDLPGITARKVAVLEAYSGRLRRGAGGDDHVR